MIVLHDGFHEFGSGLTKDEAIEDAIEASLVTREWIEQELARGAAASVVGIGLVLEELDVDDLDGES